MFKKAERRKAKFAIIVGENEATNNKVIVKNLATQVQTEIELDNLINQIYDLYDEASCQEDACEE